MKVKIGITTGWEPGTVVEGWPLIYGSKDLVDRIERAGGLPILIPILENQELIPEYIQMVDGIIVSGEVLSIKRNVMNDYSNNVLYNSNPLRYVNEEKVITESIKSNIPLLGICRGYQVLCVQQGGTVFDDDINLNTNVVHQQKEIAVPPQKPVHRVSIPKDTKLYQLINRESVMVNSFHRQAVKEVPKGYRVCATSEDGYIEGIESVKGFSVGIQFHPEALEEDIWEDFFKNFIAIVKNHKK